MSNKQNDDFKELLLESIVRAEEEIKEWTKFLKEARERLKELEK